MIQLYTRWSSQVTPDNVLPEYPRPMMARESYINLNGLWDYAFTTFKDAPAEYEGQILVPFSPEAVLSGVNRQLQPEEYLWYRRNISVEDWSSRKDSRRMLLHFGAVDQSCIVYVNGADVASHTGGYLPFSVDISDVLKDGDNELTVRVMDLSDTSYHARGKQKLNRGGMFYTATSGIWQTVWMEEVPMHYIETAEVLPDADEEIVTFTIKANEDLPVEIEIYQPALYNTDTPEEPLPLVYAQGSSNQTFDVCISSPVLWTCETPYLYYYSVKMGEDLISGYFAMRTFSVEPDEAGIPRICLNHRPQFQKGVLDQGYWPDGLYTAPTDEALIFDIENMKKMGLNMVRKHIKIEPQRWYYHCDRLGIVVWQDMVNGGDTYKSWFVTYLATALSQLKIPVSDRHMGLLSRKNAAGRKEFAREMEETISLLKCHPSIAVWVIFNEAWGQFETNKMTMLARKADPTRLIDQASGWFDQGGGDFNSIHNYFFKLKIKPEPKRAGVLSEIGGYSCEVPGHYTSDAVWGYGKHKDQDSLNAAYQDLMGRVEELIPQGLCASVFTQWSDIEDETNGIFTYDREIQKIL